MSRSESGGPATGLGAQHRAGRQRGFAGIAALAAGVGLFALIGARVKETVADRKAQASALAEQVKAAPARAGAAVVHGTARPWRPTIPITGTLSPVQDAEIGFKTGGRLTAVRVKVGDRVRAGQQLAALDVSEASAQAAATAAGVRAAQVSYDMAKDAEKRTLALFEQHAVSDAESLSTQNRAALALAQLEQARAQAQLASVGLGNGSLAAPFPGLITRAPSGVGKIVAPGEALFHVEDTSVLKLTATLSEADARLVEVGAVVSLSETSAVAVDDGAPGADGSPPPTSGGAARPVGLTGKITAVLASLDPQTRRVPVLAEIPNLGASPLLAGAFVRATVTSSKEVSVLELPPGALRPGSQDEVVLLRGGKAHLRRVTFTQAEGGALLVRSGLEAADAVVLNPSSEVREGDDLSGGDGAK
jgi:RND family efflux transporter MFP subunit